MRCMFDLMLFFIDIPLTPCWHGVSVYTSRDIGPKANCTALSVVIGTIITTLDAALYIYFPIYLGRTLRIVEGRSIFHRFGKRTIIVTDVPWVARCGEQFLSRLFSLSYGFVCPEVHSADPIDDLIHRFGHRSVRGLLLAVGRPDGRLFAFTKTEAAALLAVKQMIFVENLGEHPEVISVGSNPHFDERHCVKHVVLPSQVSLMSSIFRTSNISHFTIIMLE